MKFTSILTSVRSLLPKIISRFQSIGKDTKFTESGSGKITILKDSKDIAKARKQVKDALYFNVDSFYSQLETDDVRSVSKNQKDITISSKSFEIFLTTFYTNIYPVFETFISEKKKMGPTMAKLTTIYLSGMLIDLHNNPDNYSSKSFFTSESPDNTLKDLSLD